MYKRTRFNPEFKQILGDYWLYEHPTSIGSVVMDPKGNLIVNQSPILISGKPLSGYSVVTFDQKEGKLLLRKDLRETPQPVVRKPFIEY
jgi:hypothetical protein